jgi:hypothetical protein
MTLLNGFILMGLVAYLISIDIGANPMIASFAITNSSGKTEFIVTDSMKIFSEKEALGLVASGAIQNLQIVKSNRGRYLRSKKNQSTRDNLDFRSITPTQFWTAYNDLSRRLDRAPLIQLEKIRNENIGIATDVIVVLWWDKQKNGYVDPRPTKTRASAINFLRANRRIIVQTAKRQNIDAAILGAILIDEYCRTGWEDSFDKMAAQLFTDRSFSIGIAQIKIDTAKTLIKQKYYTPDTKLDFSRPENRKALIAYLDEPTHSINFAAAAIRQIIDTWKPSIDLSKRPEIIGTIYSQGNIRKPHAKPQSNARGDQIKNEFYPMAIETLSVPK